MEDKILPMYVGIRTAVILCWKRQLNQLSQVIKCS